MEYNIPWSKPYFTGDEKNYVLDALDSKWISNGPYVKQFEQMVCDFTGSPFAVAVSNGTTALHLGMLGLGIGPGDEVIVPAFTFIAPASMAVMCGARVVVADINKDTFCLDPESVRSVITPRTKAIVVVHLYGNVADMEPLLKISKEYGIPLIEDNAESFGSFSRNTHAGTFGSIGTLSFHASKNITTGEGGMVLTNDQDLYESMLTIREHGMRTRKTYWHSVVGHNFRLGNLHAAMGCAQLKHFTEISKKRRLVHEIYAEALKTIPIFKSQCFQEGVDPVLWVLAGRLAPANTHSLRERRDAVVAKLVEDGIETRPGFYSLDLLPPFLKEIKALPNATLASDSVIALPTYPELTREEIFYIVDRFKVRINEVFNEI